MIDPRAMSERETQGGLISTGLKVELNTQNDLATFYSPGVAEPCKVIAQNPELSKKLTIRKNTIAVVSDGSAVLGLGNIGAEASLPVMEGKCMLFKRFGDVDAFPIVLSTQNTEEIIETVKRIAPTFGGINLEDIAAPRCFEIQERLKKELDIPVFHDDQDGTAMVTLAGLINALKVAQKELSTVKIVISGAGAAGIAIARLLKSAGAQNMTLIDSKGIVSLDRTDLDQSKQQYAVTESGSLTDAIKGADVFVGVSKAGLLKGEMVQSMNQNPIIFALANPIPEIMPEEAVKHGAAIIATGRSDYPNQINNVLIFPGLFRGLLDAGATEVTTELMTAVSFALSDMVESPRIDQIIPHAMDESVAQVVAKTTIDFFEKQ